MRASLVAVCLVLAISVLAIGPAYGSCAELPPLAQAYADNDVVFKGTVEEFSNNTALVRVEEVWKGPPLDERVEMTTGAVDDDPSDDIGVASSVDRTVRQGVTYLFFPVNDSPPFSDNICTSTRRYKPALEKLREPSLSTDDSDAGGSGPSGLPRTGLPLLVWLGAAWGVMGVGLALLASARDRSRPPA